jgi:hypothetical protein
MRNVRSCRIAVTIPSSARSFHKLRRNDRQLMWQVFVLRRFRRDRRAAIRIRLMTISRWVVGRSPSVTLIALHVRSITLGRAAIVRHPDSDVMRAVTKLDTLRFACP